MPIQPSRIQRKSTVKGIRISPTRFFSIVSKGSPCLFENCTFNGPIRLANLKLESLLDFRGCTFQGLFEAPGAVFRMGLNFVDCTFEHSITLESAKVHGDLFLKHCVIHPPEGYDKHDNVDLPPYHPPPSFRSAKCSGLVVWGNLEADCLKVYGSLDLGHIEIHGAVQMRGVRVGMNMKGQKKYNGRLYVRQAYIDGDFELEPFIESLVSATPGRRSLIHGSLSVGASLIKGRLNIRGMVIHGCLHAITVEIKGRLLGDCWTHPNPAMDQTGPLRTIIGYIDKKKRSSIFFNDGRVEEAVWLHGIVAYGALDFENARIGGALEISAFPRDSSSPTSHALRSNVGRNAAYESLIIKNAHVAANIQLDGIMTKGRVAGHNSRIGAAFLCRPKRYVLKNLPAPVTSGGQARMRPPVLFQPTVGATAGHRKSLSLYGAHVGSSIEISGARLAGGVRMRYAKIEGAVNANVWKGEDDFGSSNQSSRCDAVQTEIGFTEDGQSLYLYGAEIGGNLCVQGTLMWGYLSLELAHVKGSIILSGTHVCEAARPVTCVETLKVRELKETYDALRRAKGADEDEEMLHGVRLAKAKIDNDVRMDRVRIEKNLSGNGCHILGDLLFEAKPAASRTHISGAGRHVVERRSVIKSGVLLATARIGGDVVLQSLETPAINLSSTVLGRLCLSLEEWEQREMPTDKLKAERISLKTEIELGGVEFNDIAIAEAVTYLSFGGPQTEEGRDIRSGTARATTRPKPLHHMLCIAVLTVLGLSILLSWLPPMLRPWKYQGELWWAFVATLLLWLCPFLVYSLRYLFEMYCTRRDPKKHTSAYVALLSRAKLDISTYTRVEDWLANQGDPQQADDVHYAMRRRELLMPAKDLPDMRWTWKYIYFLWAGSGTKVGRLLLAHLVVFVVAWLGVFSNPGSVEHPATYVVPSSVVSSHTQPSNMAFFGEMPMPHATIPFRIVLEAKGAKDPVLSRQSHVFWASHNGDAPGIPWGQAEREDYFTQRRHLRRTNSGANILAGEESWVQADAFWVALNVQIPLVHFWARDEWEPAASEAFFGTWFGAFSLHTQYDTLAGWIQIFSYLTIPMIIASGTRAFKRRGNQ